MVSKRSIVNPSCTGNADLENRYGQGEVERCENKMKLTTHSETYTLIRLECDYRFGSCGYASIIAMTQNVCRLGDVTRLSENGKPGRRSTFALSTATSSNDRAKCFQNSNIAQDNFQLTLRHHIARISPVLGMEKAVPGIIIKC
jgi:hypothetical protein